MIEEQGKEQIKSQLESYLQQQGINTNKHFECLNPAHKDNKPSMSYDKKRNKAHCFSCGADYDTIDVIEIQYNTDRAGAFKKAKELFSTNNIGGQPQKQGTGQQKEQKPYKNTTNYENPTEGAEQSEENKPNYKNYYLQAKENLKKQPEVLEYLHKRGLTDKTIDRFNLGYDISKQQIIIPYDEAGSFYIARNLTEKYYYKATGTEPIYNLQALYNTTGAVFITEGQFDTLSIIEAGAESIALNGTGYIKLINQLKKKPTSNTIILSFDNDTAGETASNKLLKELKDLNITCIKANVSGEFKDTNEALTKNRGVFVEAVKVVKDTIKAEIIQEFETSKIEYEKNNASNYINDFMEKIDHNAKTTAISTGFKHFDNELHGGLYEGLYIIGAISSLGKTTFVLQIADQIAQQGQDVLIFSLEMARTELMAKSISRITLLECKGNRNNAKTTRGITAGRKWDKDHYEEYTEGELKLLAESIGKYKEYAKYIYISEGLGDIGAEQIKQTVDKHFNITGKKPIVIIDYLQILAPADIRSTDKQNTDKAVMELKRISRDFKIPIIAISSLNRDSYTSKISMKAFKESGAIEYSSDVLIGLQFQTTQDLNDEVIDKEKRKETRKIELKILKNRNGATGGQINYDYYPMFNYFLETDKEEE